MGFRLYVLGATVFFLYRAIEWGGERGVILVCAYLTGLIIGELKRRR